MRKLLLVAVVLMGGIGLCMSTGCTATQAAYAQNITNETKQIAAIADATLNAANVLVNAADPSSKVAARISTITTNANKVNGVAQSINIIIPVESVVPAPVVTPAPVSTSPTVH